MHLCVCVCVCVCVFSAQLIMFSMEKCHRSKMIITSTHMYAFTHTTYTHRQANTQTPFTLKDLRLMPKQVLGFDQAPYRSLYLPAQAPPDYQIHGLDPLPEDGLGDLPSQGLIPDDGLSSEDEEDEEEDGLEMYGHVDLKKVRDSDSCLTGSSGSSSIAILRSSV